MKKLVVLFCLLFSCVAHAQQPIVQSGFATPGHALYFLTNGVAADAGTAAQGFLTSIGVTAQGPGICQNSAPITQSYNQICLIANSTGNAGISFFNHGTTAAFTISVNGVVYQFPFTGGAIGPPSTVVGDFSCWNNTVGTLLSDCKLGPPSTTIGDAACWDNTVGTLLSDCGGGNVFATGPFVVGDIPYWTQTSTPILGDSGVSYSNVPLLNGNNTFSGTNIFSGNAILQSGRPACDPGVSPGATNSDDTAIYKCINTLSALGGGRLTLGPGTYCTTAGISTSGILPTATSSGTATSSAVLNFTTTPTGVVAGMTAYDYQHSAALINASGLPLTVIGTPTGTTVTLSADVSSPGVSAGDMIFFTFGGPIDIVGSGTHTTTLVACNHNVPVLTLLAGYGSTVSNLQVEGHGENTTDTGSTSYPALYLRECVKCRVDHVDASYGLHAIEVQGGCDCIISDTNSSFAYGDANFYVAASYNGGITSGWLRRVKADDTYPSSTGIPSAVTGCGSSCASAYGGGGTLGAWATGQAYSLDALVTKSGWVLQCMNCVGVTTSGASLSIPSLYGVNASDGALLWQLVSPIGSANIYFGSGAYQWSGDMVDMTGPHTYNLYANDDQGYGGGSLNGLLQFTNSTFGQAFTENINIAIGSQDKFVGNTISTCLIIGCVNVYIDNSFGAEFTLANNTIYEASFGFDWGAGNYINLNNNFFSAIGSNAADTTSGRAAVIAAVNNTFYGAFNGNVSSNALAQNHQFWNVGSGPDYISGCGNIATAAATPGTPSATHLSPSTWSTCNF